MKKVIIVTGGAGFIGSNLVEFLLENTDYSVVVLDSLTYAGDSRNLAGFWRNPRFVFIEGSINSQFLVQALLEKYQPLGIMHLAAESHVDNSIMNADTFISTNIVGTYRLLDASRKYITTHGIRNFRFLHVSTDEVYGSLIMNSQRFNEDSKYQPNSPYSASKASSDHLVRAYHETFGLNTVITNCSNNYGPKQHPEKLIPKTILNGLSWQNIPLYGNGKNVRDWIYVKDHCRGLVEVFERGISGDTYCIGGNNEQTNRNIVTLICEELDNITQMKEHANLIHHVPDRLGHDLRYAIDSSKIFRELSWEPEVSFRDGIRYTIDWYIENQKRYQK